MSQDVKLKLAVDGLEKAEQDIKKLADTVKNLQSELNKGMKMPSGTPRAGAGGEKTGADTYREALQVSRAKAQDRERDQAALYNANAALAARNREIDKLAVKQKAITGDKKAELDYEREMNRLIKERNVHEEAGMQIRKRIGGRSQQGRTGGGGGGGGEGGGGGVTGASAFGRGGITSLSGAASAIGIPAMAIGGAATAIAAGLAGESVRQFYAQAGNRARTVGSEAYNLHGQAGQLLGSAISGGGLEDVMFAPQRQQAARIARQTLQENINSPFRQFRNLISNREEILETLGLGTADTNRLAQEKRDKEQATIQAEQEEALRNGPQSKIETESKNKFLKDWRRNLDFQRQTGLSEGGFRNFLGGVNGAGFSDELGMGMSSAILGAGGSTRAATGNAAFALQMGRQFDLTNAGQAMGAISGQLGGQQQSKDALISIQAEGTRIGLNRSEFREENRRFVEMAAGIINKSNVTDTSGVDQVMEMFTRAMTGVTTTSGLEAGKSVYEAYQKQSNIQSGPSAVMRAAGMRGDKVLGQLDERDRAKLSMMQESEINTNNDTIQAMAAKYHLSESDIVKNMHGVIDRSLFVNPTTDAAIKKYREAQKKFKPGSKELSLARGEAAGEIRTEGFGADMNQKQLDQAVDMLAANDHPGMAKLQEDVKNQAESGKTTRPGDEMEKQQAAFSRMANEMFTTLGDAIEPTAKKTAELTANIKALLEAMKSGDPGAIARAQRNFEGLYGPQDQPQTGTGGHH